MKFATYVKDRVIIQIKGTFGRKKRIKLALELFKRLTHFVINVKKSLAPSLKRFQSDL